MLSRIRRVLKRAARSGNKIQNFREQLARIETYAQLTFHSSGVYIGDSTVITRLVSGQLIFVDTESVDIGIHLIMGGQWETASVNLFRSLLKSGDTVLDVGANHGVYALIAASLVGSTGVVRAFEPQPRLCSLMAKSFRVNGFNHAIAYNVALGDRDEPARLYIDSLSPGGASLFAGAERTSIDIEMRTLDRLLPDVDVDVVKIDVEGHEGVVFIGMEQAIDRSPNLKIIMEWCPEMMAATAMPASATAGFLEKKGFKAWTIEPDVRPSAWKTLIAPETPLQNILVARTL